MKEKTICYKFKAYEPQVKPLSNAQGGGFIVTLSVSETEFESIKEINNPQNKGCEFIVILEKVKN